MKQKNLILMVVAVVIGLAAAFVTSQLGAEPAAPPPVDKGPKMIKVPVAKQTLQVGTLIKEGETDKLFKSVEVPEATVPKTAVTDLKQVSGKRLTRRLQEGSQIFMNDVTDAGQVRLPDGKLLYPIKFDVINAAAGFALPGNEVDVILLTNKDEEQQVIMLKRKMLVVAVDIMDRKPPDGGVAVPELKSVSLAVTPKESLQLRLAEAKGTLKLALRNPGDNDTSKIEPVKSIFEEDAPKVTMVVAAKNVPAGIQLTPENISDYFRQEERERAPSDSIPTLKDLTGRYMVGPIFKGQYVPTQALTFEAPKKEEPKEAGSKKAEPEKEKPKKVKPAVPQYERSRLTIRNGGENRAFDFYRLKGQRQWQVGPAPAPANPAADRGPAPRFNPTPNRRPEPKGGSGEVY